LIYAKAPALFSASSRGILSTADLADIVDVAALVDVSDGWSDSRIVNAYIASSAAHAAKSTAMRLVLD
jgi:hypothetical protein